MDPAWLLQLDEQTRNLLVGAAGNLVGNLATQAVNGLLNAGTRQLRRRYEAEPERQALDTAMAQALATTLAWLTDDPDAISHLTTLFAAWLALDAVTDELYQLLEPTAETTWDLELLTSEFVAAGWSPESIDQERSFAEIVAKLVDAFTNAAAKQPLLQPLLQLRLLQSANHQLQELVQQQDSQIALQQQMVALLQRFAPLDLTEAEQPYLRQLYWQCNDLPLIRERRDLERYSKARLQRVYVDLELKHAPSIELILNRLDFKGKRPRTKAKESIAAALKAAAHPEPDRTPEHPQRRKPASLKDFAFSISATAVEHEITGYPNATIVALHNLPEEQRNTLTQALQVSDEQFQAALGNLTPLEALREHKQIVILGDPGSGKSTYTQRLAALFAAISCHDRELRADLEQSEVDAITRLLTTLGRPLLPVRIVLSQWAKCWALDKDYAKASAAVVGWPYRRRGNYDVGFRVVVIPISR